MCTQARISPHGSRNGTWSAARPPMRSWPSGSFCGRTKKPPTIAWSMPVRRHQCTSVSRSGSDTTRARSRSSENAATWHVVDAPSGSETRRLLTAGTRAMLDHAPARWISWIAQPLPSGSLKNTKRPHGNSCTSV